MGRVVPATVSRRALANATKPGWQVEPDYQNLKQKLGLGRYERRGWRGFHHHAACASLYVVWCGRQFNKSGYYNSSLPILVLVINGLKSERERASEGRKLLEWGFGSLGR